MVGAVTRLVVGVLASVVMTPVLAVENVAVSGLFGSKAVLEIDGKRRVLKVGESSPEGVVLIALQGETAVVEFDGKRERIALGSEISGSFAPAATKEERYWPDNNGLYRAHGAINSQPVTFMIDTGANQVAMNSGVAQRLGIDYKKRGERAMASTASDVIVVYRVMLDTVQVGKITQHQVSAVVIEGSQPSEVLLGMSFLSRLDMAREGEVMTLKQKW
jgi:aspartyl protease family protein